MSASSGVVETRGRSFALRLLVAFVAIDLTFKVLVGLAFIHVMGGRAELLPTIGKVVPPIWMVWVAVMWLVVRPVDRVGSPTEIRRAGELCNALPWRLAAIWTLQWAGELVAVVVVDGAGFDLGVTLFLVALVFGPFPLSHALTVWLVATRRRTLELEARTHGVVLRGRPATISLQLTMYALCIAIAPSAYMAAIGLSARIHMTPFDTIMVAVVVGFVAVGVFAVMCAVLVASAFTRPVASMTDVLRTVAEQASAQRISRIPQYQRDEIGILVEVANDMLERLERAQVERETARANLEQLTRTLEERVEQRTKELVDMNASLEREQSQRHMIEHELDLARKIQVSILPQRWNVDGLDIAAAMVTASKVGGDYYDILPRPRGGWIGIGDVSGHGVSAGLIMLMVQSITATLVEMFPHALPKDLVVALDRVLFRNVRHRLGVNDFVTFTLLRYDGGGHIQFAGAHEDLIIWRAKTGHCERLATPGPWIATNGHIDDVIVESELQLEKDDLLVLYTDGITEARDGKRQQFGIERLCEEIEHLARQTTAVEQIGARVIERARSWCATQEDDMSIVVARQL